ncbi:MAG: hypothetical protein LPK03_10820 [Pontibacter sp.]|nr:hypothetical protein [Pontibacter sp.]
MKNKILAWAGGVLAFILLLFALLFVFRSKVLNYTIERVIAKVENKYPADLNIGNAEFVGWNSVLITDISFVPHDLDTLFTTDSVFATVSFRSIFKGRIVFKRLEVTDSYLTAVKNGDVTNFAFLFKDGEQVEQPEDTTSTGRNYGMLLNRVIETEFDNVPDQVDFKNLNASYTSPNRTIDVKMPYLLMDDGHIESEVYVRTDSLVNNMRVRGTIDPGDYRIATSLYAADTNGIRLPYVQQKLDAKVAFDTLHISLNDKKYRNEMLTVSGRAMVDNLVLNQPKLADEDIFVQESAVDYVVTLGPNLYVIDSLTEVRVNNARANVYAAYQNETSKIIDLKVKTEKVPANDFFNSLPQGLFENLEGIKAQGWLQYDLNFHVNMDSLEQVVFNSDLDASEDFKIV